RFDGYAFANYGTAEGLPHPYVNDLLQTRGGEYWVATNGGLVRFDPKGTPGKTVIFANEAADSNPMFAVVVPNDSDRRAKAITVLFEDNDGIVWCGTMRGLYRLENTQTVPSLRFVDIGIPTDPEQSIISDILEDQFGSLWIATPSGLYHRWPDGSSARYTSKDGLPGDHLHDLFRDAKGNLWVATRLNGFFSVAIENSHKAPVITRALSQNDGLPQNWVFQLFETSSHRIWVATARGLAEFFPEGDERGQFFHAYGEKNGLAHRDITAIEEDLAGNLWVGSYAGAMKL